jgi:hypothetical protein
MRQIYSSISGKVFGLNHFYTLVFWVSEGDYLKRSIFVISSLLLSGLTLFFFQGHDYKVNNSKGDKKVFALTKWDNKMYLTTLDNQRLVKIPGRSNSLSLDSNGNVWIPIEYNSDKRGGNQVLIV